MTTLDDLRREYVADRIGPIILSEIVVLASRLTHRYDPRIYGNDSTSWDDALEDFVQDFTSEVMLREGQLDYVFATAEALDDFRALLWYQARRFMGRRRKRTVIDNLLDRARPILAEPPFIQVRDGFFTVDGAQLTESLASDDRIRALARELAGIPRVQVRSGERVPVVYSQANLRILIEGFANGLGSPFNAQDLARCLDQLLTFWIAGHLEDLERVAEPEDPDLLPEEDVVVQEAVSELDQRLTVGGRLIIRRKLQNAPDTVIARELGVSRTTIAERKSQVLAEVAEVMGGVEEKLHRFVMEALHDQWKRS